MLKPSNSSILLLSRSTQTESVIPKPKRGRKRGRKHLGSGSAPVVDKRGSQAALAGGRKGRMTALGTNVEFMSPEDNSLYENKTAIKPHMVAVGPEQSAKDEPTSTTGDTSHAMSPTESVTGPESTTPVVTNQSSRVFIRRRSQCTRLMRRPRRLSESAEPCVTTNFNNNCASTQTASAKTVVQKLLTVEDGTSSCVTPLSTDNQGSFVQTFIIIKVICTIIVIPQCFTCIHDILVLIEPLIGYRYCTNVLYVQYILEWLCHIHCCSFTQWLSQLIKATVTLLRWSRPQRIHKRWEKKRWKSTQPVS